MADPYIGEIRMFCGNYAPMGWALCDGQMLQIAQYSALYSILGIQFGGNGQTTFGLPDLRGRFPMHMGAGPNLTPRRIGEAGGCENVALTAAQMPVHNHAAAMQCQNTTGGRYSQDPTNNYPSYTDGAKIYAATPNATMNAATVQTQQAGQGQAHTNMPPFECVNFIIALEGEYPPRS
jgi:microcystin-dependent protein